MRQTAFTILENTPIARDTYRLRLAGDTAAFKQPGQFVNLSLPGYYLRRPFSACDWQKGELLLIYKVLGQGTADLVALRPGTRLDALCGLGRGFDLNACGRQPLLVGGGVGVPPLYRLARELVARGRTVRVALGFNTAADAFLVGELQALGAQVRVATLDGSLGERGTVLAVCDADSASDFCACGPTAMLKALCAATRLPGQVSLEERMGCGFGACMGCTVMTPAGPLRVCREGPVFDREVLAW
ncbi:MAG: dihydroorotate dehydrogenase electron transfer subunit [Clostridiales bacterium]|nr:dihydroorotate dehydrogenase electron transfer subunit [Clostridiales bacterium]